MNEYPENVDATPEQIENIISRDKPGSDHLYYLYPSEVKNIKDTMIGWNNHTVDDFREFQNRRMRKRHKEICTTGLIAIIVTFIVLPLAIAGFLTAHGNEYLGFGFLIIGIISPLSTFAYFRRYYIVNGNILD